MRDDPMRGDVLPSTVDGEIVIGDERGIDPALLAAAASSALDRMSREGQSGSVEVSMKVSIRQGLDEPDPLTPAQLAERQSEQSRFALGMAIALGVTSGLFAASLSFVPDPLGFLVGVVAAVWIYGQVKP